MPRIIISNEHDLDDIYNKFKKHCKNYGEAILEQGKVLTLAGDDGSVIKVNLIEGAQAIACSIRQGEYSARFSTDSYEILMENGKAVLGEEFFYTNEELEKKDKEDNQTTLSMERD